MTEIKPCPFCGGEATLYANWSPNANAFFVNCKCTVCDSSGKGYKSKDDPAEQNWENYACEQAVRLWNSRPYQNEEFIQSAKMICEYVLNNYKERGDQNAQGRESEQQK